MEFFNVGGGELLIIILFALVLFSPEDILKLMRSVGKYARTARQMWSNVSKSLQEDYIPEDVKEVVKETASSVKEAQNTISDVRKQFSSVTTAVEKDVGDAVQLADADISEVISPANKKADKNQSKKPIRNADTESVKQPAQKERNDGSLESMPVAISPISTTSSADSIDTSTHPVPDHETLVDTQKIIQSSSQQDNVPQTVHQDSENIQIEQNIKDVTTPNLVKDDATKLSDVKSTVYTNEVNAKLVKVIENTFKDDGNDS
jgi:Sec-independent protein translocase protein TatA